MVRTGYRAFGAYRFLLAFIVLLSHTWFFTFGLDGGTFVQSLGIGDIGVMGFFCLSGFVILEAVDRTYANRPVAFVANRFLRLVPPYLVALIVSAGIHGVLLYLDLLRLPFDESVPTDLFSMPNLLVNTTAIIPVVNFNNVFPGTEWYLFVRFAWAIFIEFIFYLFVFAAIVGWKFVAARFLPLVLYAAMALVFALCLHFVHEVVRPLHYALAFVPYFGFGAAVYGWVTHRSKLSGIFATLCFVLLLLHFARYTQEASFWSEWLRGLSDPSALVPIILMALAAIVLPALSRLTPTENAICLDKRLGDQSYAIYLNHYAFIVLGYSLWQHQSVLLQITVICMALAASWVLERAVEEPMKHLRTRVRGHAV